VEERRQTDAGRVHTMRVAVATQQGGTAVTQHWNDGVWNWWTGCGPAAWSDGSRRGF